MSDPIPDLDVLDQFTLSSGVRMYCTRAPFDIPSLDRVRGRQIRVDGREALITSVETHAFQRRSGNFADKGDVIGLSVRFLDSSE